jgi:hypothetical protein
MEGLGIENWLYEFCPELVAYINTFICTEQAGEKTAL